MSIGLVHTLVGPDHYLPFLMIARAQGWKLSKTTWVTVLCGLGHVLGSLLIGLVGITLGVAVGFLEQVEALRGALASWLLIGFGVAYAAWGLRLGLRARLHDHDRGHADRSHRHEHHHLGSHAHLHGDPSMVTPWVLFVIFVLGPCEPLIPILMYPAARGDWTGLAWVTLAFGATTIITMTTIVVVATKGAFKLNLGPLEPYSQALAGLIIALSGLAILVLGL